MYEEFKRLWDSLMRETSPVLDSFSESLSHDESCALAIRMLKSGELDPDSMGIGDIFKIHAFISDETEIKLRDKVFDGECFQIMNDTIVVFDEFIGEIKQHIRFLSDFVDDDGQLGPYCDVKILGLADKQRIGIRGVTSRLGFSDPRIQITADGEITINPGIHYFGPDRENLPAVTALAESLIESAPRSGLFCDKQVYVYRIGDVLTERQEFCDDLTSVLGIPEVRVRNAKKGEFASSGTLLGVPMMNEDGTPREIVLRIGLDEVTTLFAVGYCVMMMDHAISGASGAVSIESGDKVAYNSQQTHIDALAFSTAALFAFYGIEVDVKSLGVLDPESLNRFDLLVKKYIAWISSRL